MSWNFIFKTSTVFTPLCPVPILPKPYFSEVLIYVCGNFCIFEEPIQVPRWNLEERWPDTPLHLFWWFLPAAQPPPFTSANSGSMDSAGTQGIPPFQGQLPWHSWRLRGHPLQDSGDKAWTEGDLGVVSRLIPTGMESSHLVMTTISHFI